MPPQPNMPHPDLIGGENDSSLAIHPSANPGVVLSDAQFNQAMGTAPVSSSVTPGTVFSDADFEHAMSGKQAPPPTKTGVVISDAEFARAMGGGGAQPEPTLWQRNTRPFERGLYQAGAGTNELLGNLAGTIANAADYLSEKTGMDKAQLTPWLRDYFHNKAKDITRAMPPKVSDDFLSNVAEDVTHGIGEMPAYALAARSLGAAPGMAAVGALQNPDKPGEGALTGALQGGMFHAVSPLAMPTRAALLGGAELAATGDPRQAATMGAMGLMGPRGGMPLKETVLVAKDNPLVRAGAETLRSFRAAFAPEAISEKAADTGATARYRVFELAQKQAEAMARLQPVISEFNAVPKPEQVRFVDAIMRGEKQPNGSLQGFADEFRTSFEANYAAEKAAGLDYAFYQDYFPGIWKKPEQAQKFINSWVMKQGKASFTKEKQFHLFSDAIAAGLEPAGNPAELVLMRQEASNRAVTRQQFINDLVEMGIATKSGGDVKYRPGEMGKVIGADGKEYYVPADVMPVINNSSLLPQKSLWNSRGLGGTSFRGYMMLKNAAVPLKLALSLFHPLHIAGINIAHNMAIYARPVMEGKATIGEATREIGKSLTMVDPWALKEGGKIQDLYIKPKGQLTEHEAWQRQTANEAGFAPVMDHAYKIKATANMRAAWEQSHPLRAAGWAAPAAIEMMQKPIFEVYVPRLKAAAFYKEVDLLYRQRPELWDDANKTTRQQALQNIAKSIDNRFGELAYKGLFWNKTAKELAIAGSLSLGWRLGTWREYTGAVADAGRTAASVVKRKGVPKEVGTRMAFVLAYTAQAMLVSALTQYALTGKVPEESKDYFFPKSGQTNPDGSVARLTLPYLTKDLFALYQQMRKHGPVSGLLEYAKSGGSPVLSTVGQLAKNRDYFGAEIRDPKDPIAQQALDVSGHIIKDMLSPISLASYERDVKTGMPKETAGILSAMGISPAAKYMTQSEIQEEITNRAEELRGAPLIPKTKSRQDQVRRDIMDSYLSGKPQEAQGKLREAMATGVITEQQARSMVANADIPPDVKTFKALSQYDGSGESQARIMAKMSLEELKRYAFYAGPKARAKLYTLSPAGAEFVRRYQAGEITKPKWSKGKLVEGGQ